MLDLKAPAGGNGDGCGAVVDSPGPRPSLSLLSQGVAIFTEKLAKATRAADVVGGFSVTNMGLYDSCLSLRSEGYHYCELRAGLKSALRSVRSSLATQSGRGFVGP